MAMVGRRRRRQIAMTTERPAGTGGPTPDATTAKTTSVAPRGRRLPGPPRRNFGIVPPLKTTPMTTATADSIAIASTTSPAAATEFEMVAAASADACDPPRPLLRRRCRGPRRGRRMRMTTSRQTHLAPHHRRRRRRRTRCATRAGTNPYLSTSASTTDRMCCAHGAARSFAFKQSTSVWV
jgi:hypothetical protein